MGFQTFNDTASVNGKVSGSGAPAAPEGASGPAKKGGISGVEEKDGAANLRANQQTKRAEPQGVATSAPDRSIKGVQSFGGTSV